MDTAALAQALRIAPRQLGVLPPYWPVRPQFHLHGVDQVPSTNAALWHLLAQGAPAGSVMVATTQSAGRGQWGRQWQSAPGGLYLSLALKPDLPLSSSTQLTLASAWGIATSLENLGLTVGLKWPNDLVFGGRKLGGILTETRVEQDCIRDVVIGVGLNWENPVPPTGLTLEQLQRIQGKAPITGLEHLAAIVLYGLLQGYLHLQAQGAEALMAAYQKRMVNLGQQVMVEGTAVAVTGVNSTGSLRVRPSPERRSVAGEIVDLQPGEVSLGYNT